MSAGRHAKPRPPRSDTPLLLLVILLAVAVAATPWAVAGMAALRACVVGLALLAVIVLLATRRSGRRQTHALADEVDRRTREVRSLRLELDRVSSAQFDLVTEVARLREELSDFVAPVPATPDPIYPSLHLPLVRAAFAGEAPAPEPLRVSQPRPMSESAHVEVTADSGSDAEPHRELLDLTASEISRIRQAHSA